MERGMTWQRGRFIQILSVSGVATSIVLVARWQRSHQPCRCLTTPHLQFVPILHTQQRRMVKSVFYLAVLACACSGASATESPRLRVGQPLAENPDVSTEESIVPTECTINGETFVNVKYLTGDFLKAGSIYARCLPTGKVRCFVDDGDRTLDDAEETSCDAVQPTSDDSEDALAE